jgi:hypothetical protein
MKRRQVSEAIRQWKQAESLYRDLGVPRAAEVAARIAGVRGSPGSLA